MALTTAPIATGQAVGTGPTTVATLSPPYGGGQNPSGKLQAVCEVATVPTLATLTVTFVGATSGITYGTRTFVNGAASSQSVSVNAEVAVLFNQIAFTPAGVAENILVKIASSSAAGNTTAGFAAAID